MTNSPAEMAEKGDRIYNERYRAAYERDYSGKFVAIDVTTGQAHLADSPEKALEDAEKANPRGAFHLIRVGSPGIFRVGFVSKPHGDWIFGRPRKSVS